MAHLFSLCNCNVMHYIRKMACNGYYNWIAFVLHRVTCLYVLRLKVVWGLSPPVKYFTDCSKAVLLLWIFYVFVLSCVFYVFVRACLYVLCGHLQGKGWPLGSRLWCLLWVCHFPIGILGQVWYLIVSIPDLCTLTYFNYLPQERCVFKMYWR